MWFILAASDFTTPLTLFALDLNVMELTVMRRQPQQFDSDGINVQQFWTTSADGERIPYFHVGKNATPDTPTLVYAYGGFGIPDCRIISAASANIGWKRAMPLCWRTSAAVANLARAGIKQRRESANIKALMIYWQSCAICPNAA